MDRKKYMKEYLKKYFPKYMQLEKNKAAHRKANQRDWIKNKFKRQIQKRKWQRSENGKIADKRTKAKRKRNLGWILMFENPFADSVPVEYHHITNVYVVAIPKDLHKLYGGKYHRKKTMEIVKQIYLGK